MAIPLRAVSGKVKSTKCKQPLIFLCDLSQISSPPEPSAAFAVVPTIQRKETPSRSLLFCTLTSLPTAPISDSYPYSASKQLSFSPLHPHSPFSPLPALHPHKHFQPAHSRTQIQYDVSHLTALRPRPERRHSVPSRFLAHPPHRAPTAALRRLCSSPRPRHWRATISRFSMVSPALCVFCNVLSKGLSQQRPKDEKRKKRRP